MLSDSVSFASLWCENLSGQKEWYLSFLALIQFIYRSVLGTCWARPCECRGVKWLTQCVCSCNSSARKQWFGAHMKIVQHPWIPCSIWTGLHWRLCRIWFIPAIPNFFIDQGGAGGHHLSTLHLLYTLSLLLLHCAI